MNNITRPIYHALTYKIVQCANTNVLKITHVLQKFLSFLSLLTR
jgi:hypothetical protein